MRRAAIAFLAGLLVTPATLGAQQLRELLVAPGARLRVTAPALGFRARVVTSLRVTADSLTVRQEEPWRPAVASVPLDAVTKLEVSLGRSPRIRHGVLFGALAGATAGGIAGNLTWAPCAAQRVAGCPFYKSRVAVTAGWAALSALTGSFVGYLVEKASIGERWVDAPLVPLPQGRAGVGAGWRF